MLGLRSLDSRYWWAALISILWVLPLAAQQYAVVKTTPLAADQDYWDYLLADSDQRKLYVTLGDQLQIWDLDSARLVARIQGMKRIHGVALVPDRSKAFITDGGADEVLVVDLKSNSITDRIPVGKAPDAILFEPTRQYVYAFNAHSHNASVIDAESDKVIGTIALGGLPEFAATDGKGTVYVNLESKNSVVRLTSDGGKVRNEWALAGCKEPSGLAVDPSNRRLFSVCANKVLIVSDADTGALIARVPVGNEPDAVIYDSERKLLFSSNSDGTMTVIRQDTPNDYSVVQNVATEKEARTVALDRKTNKLYLPSGEITRPAQEPGGLAQFNPATLHLIVVAPK